MIGLLKDLELGLKTADGKEEKETFLSILTNKEFIDKSKANDEEKAFIERLEKQYLGAEKKETPKTEKKTTRKAKATAKKTAKKPRAKVSPEEKAEKKRKVSQATGKTLEECKEILAKYEALRGKTTAKDKQRVEKLEKEDKLIDGTTTKTAEATTETTTKSVPKKIKQEVDAIEKEAEKEAKKEVDSYSIKGKKKSLQEWKNYWGFEVVRLNGLPTVKDKNGKVWIANEVPLKLEDELRELYSEDIKEIHPYMFSSKGTKRSETKEGKKEVERIAKEKIEEKVEDMTSDLADAGKKFIKSIQTEIAKYSKDDAKKFLLDIKSQVDTLLKAYAYGGELEGAVQHYNIAWAGGDRPLPEYAKGGKTKRGYHQDRARLSQEPWEQAYLPKRKGNYYADGGIIEPMLEGTKRYESDVDSLYTAMSYLQRHFKHVPTYISYEEDEKGKYGVLRVKGKMFAKGGRTSIEYQGVEFTPQMYKGIMGDKDKDGVPNADDVEPSNPSVTEKIEENTPFTETFNKLLNKKKKYDDTMYSIVGKMEQNLPEKYNIIARTKTPFSILKKLVDKRIDGANGLDDIIGTTIATNNNKELREVSSMIGTEAGDVGIFGKVIEIDDKFKKPKCGYTAIHYIVEYEGSPVEIQLKTKRMKKLNEFSHPFYKREDLDCDGMGELSEIVTMADNGSEEAKKEFDEIYANKDLMRSMISLSGKKFAEGGEVEWFDYSNIGLKELPFDLDRYFIKTPDTVEIDLDFLEPTRAREKGVKNANKYMRMAYDGEMDRRKPISVYERDGRFFVYDGNSTIANAKNSGWESIYVEMMDDPNEDMFQDGGVIEINEDFSNVPAELMEVFGMMDIDEEGSYSQMERLRELARQRGYDFDYDLGGQPIDYWEIPKEYMARGGRTKHSLMQDRRRVSSQPWEKAYQKRKRS